MFFLAVLLVVVLPLAELWLIVEVGREIGFLTTVAALVAVSFAGTAILRIEGFRVFRQFTDAVRRGETPSREIVHGACLLAAGVFLLAPGFISDVIGILLLLPPVRGVVVSLVARRSRGRGSRRVVVTRTRWTGAAGPVREVGSTVGDVIDVEDVAGEPRGD